MREVGILLARALDSLGQHSPSYFRMLMRFHPVTQHLHESSPASFAALIADSQTSKARLLHYYALPDRTLTFDSSLSSAPTTASNEDDLCGWHVDHSLLTALCPSLYLFHPASDPSLSYPISCPASDAGLFIKPRSSTHSIRTVIPSNCLAFQTGQCVTPCRHLALH
jgi:hypothetical protein